MKLTQRQLALLARVSAPTISCFEQAAKDIQLSSALAILEALGMTDKRSLVFPDAEFLSDTRGVIFWGQDGPTPIRCCVSLEALTFHFSDGGRLRREAAFEKHRPEIEGLVRRKYLLGLQEPDGTVLLRPEDLQ